VQRKIDGSGCKTAEEFKATVRTSLANLPKEELYNWFRSMKDKFSEWEEKILILKLTEPWVGRRPRALTQY
jgi:hypothetical protein